MPVPVKFSDYYEAVAAKFLTAVDAEPERSNQHEVGGLVKAGFSEFLGDPGQEVIEFEAKFYFFDDIREQPLIGEGSVSWYDARRNIAHRGRELRLYYNSNRVTEEMAEGDLMVLAKSPQMHLDLIFARAGSEISKTLLFLFGIEEVSDRRFDSNSFENQRLDEVRSAIIQVLDLSSVFNASPSDFEDLVTAHFGTTFPSTREFSAFARETQGEVNGIDDPDDTLLHWMQQEENLFRALERVVVSDKLAEGFEDVDDFVSFSLSVQNRRKSRAGYALENHLEVLFSMTGLDFTRGATTENRSKPDFLFPSESAYHDELFDTANLDLVGVKTTCKDRWRQVLSEAEKIPAKHLLTLEVGISPQQIEEMESHNLQLVVPKPLHKTYAESVRRRLMSVGQLIENLQSKQSAY